MSDYCFFVDIDPDKRTDALEACRSIDDRITVENEGSTSLFIRHSNMTFSELKSALAEKLSWMTDEMLQPAVTI